MDEQNQNAGTAATPQPESELTYDKFIETIKEAQKHISFDLGASGGSFSAIAQFSRMPVIVSQVVPQFAKKKITVRRTLRERLFSRPWRPWISKKIIEVDDPETSAFWMLQNRFMMMHPAVKEQVMAQLHNAYRVTSD